MLQTRKGRVAQATATLGAALMVARHRMVAADPGLARLTLAARGTLSVLLTTLAAMLAAPLAGTSPVEFASGITLSMMGPFLMREPTLRQRQRTLLALVLPAAASTVMTALLHGRGLAGDSCFLALVFLCFLLHPRGPRMIGMGLVAVITAYVGLYLELPPATLPLQLLSLLGAVPIIAFACFVVVPMNPARMLRRTVEAVQWRAAQVLRSARHAQASQQDGAAMRAAGALRRDLARLNEAAVAADGLLDLLQPGGRDAVRAGLIDLELAAARLADALRREQPGSRQTIRLRLHEHRMRRGRRYAMPADAPEPGSLRGALVALGRALHALGVAAGEVMPERDLAAPPALPPGPLAWRMAARVTLAAALAMAGGMALSPQRWFWAVITVYVVFLNARSRGDTIYKGLQRMGGTLLGIASGLALATLLAGHEALQIMALLLSIFGMFYYFLVSYTAGIFCVTVMLGLLYGMLGASLESLLVLRLEETVIGAVAAVLVAAFVLPARTRDQVMRSGRAVLEALGAAVRASRQALAGVTASPAVSPMEAMRRVDRQVADLRLALAPLTVGRSLLRRSPLERPVPALLDCVHWARVLAAASQQRAPDVAGLVAQATRIETRLAALAAPGAIVTATPSLPTLGDEAAPGTTQAALDRLDRAVGLLAERLEIGAREGFALED